MNKYFEKLISSEIPVIFDYDGVLFEARWYEERMNIPNETEEKLLEAVKRGECLDTTPILYMQNIVNAVKGDCFILSHIHNDIEHEFKKKQIAKYFPKIAQENILRADSPNHKMSFLREIEEKYGGFIYIDDNHDVLKKFENIFDTNCKFFHSSSMFV